MPPVVKLTVTEGPLVGQEFVFARPARCFVGRASDCDIELPNEEWNRMVSRHHCVLVIDPPAIHIRDLGSLNGTFVNGTKIGARDHAMGIEDVVRMRWAEHNLRDGDHVQVGDHVFEVAVQGAPEEDGACWEIGDEVERWNEGSEVLVGCDA